MLESVILIILNFILICLTAVFIFVTIRFFRTIIGEIIKAKKELSDFDKNLDDIVSRIKLDGKESDYRELEKLAESVLAEEGDEELTEEASLYMNEEGKFDYRSYAKNKAKREKEKTEPEFIDEFEQAAEETEKAERKNRYV